MKINNDNAINMKNSSNENDDLFDLKNKTIVKLKMLFKKNIQNIKQIIKRTNHKN